MIPLKLNCNFYETARLLILMYVQAANWCAYYLREGLGRPNVPYLYDLVIIEWPPGKSGDFIPVRIDVGDLCLIKVVMIGNANNIYKRCNKKNTIQKWYKFECKVIGLQEAAMFDLSPNFYLKTSLVSIQVETPNCRPFKYLSVLLQVD